ncbi:MAG: Methyltransferase corrinoid activation protein [Bacteroidetes bacterium]|nr:Methyltransferase corrinoid activation protein [Bacteroidota bacterium]
MSNTVRIRLQPMGASFEVPRGTPLQDELFPFGVEFPCGGKGKCKGCRVRVVEGDLSLTPEQERMLSPEERAAGWRLSCQCRANSDLVLELAQWEAQILADTKGFAFIPRRGLGIAIDVGTTTLVAQLLDMERAEVLAVRTALNPQARYGADIMSRVGHAVAEKGHARLVEVIRHQIGKMIDELLEAAHRGGDHIADIVLVGNTVMHHLFCDFSVEPLSHYPFEPEHLEGAALDPGTLGWSTPGLPPVRFLPNIGGFVGSDILAGVFATGIHSSSGVNALIDLGTNGEIVVGNDQRMICASTAAGPAFEGARISMGMRASTGAVAGVHASEGRLVCHVLGNVAPRGICGSGLVDAVAGSLDLGMILPAGRMAGGVHSLMLCDPVQLSQTDVRELQLAKGAIAAGVRLLLREFPADVSTIGRVHLAGAFGNYVGIASARRIGLLQFATERIHAAGNTALLGAKMALFVPPAECESLARRIIHVSLSELPEFQDTYVEEMLFPADTKKSREMEV